MTLIPSSGFAMVRRLLTDRSHVRLSRAHYRAVLGKISSGGLRIAAAPVKLIRHGTQHL
jgi:hypothetical protein